MIKNIVIALLIGIIVGQLAHADTVVAPGITRRDLLEAAALCGILANSRHNPLGWSHTLMANAPPKTYSNSAKQFADALQ